MTRTQMIRPTLWDAMHEVEGQRYWLAQLSQMGVTLISRSTVQSAWVGVR